MNIHGKFLGILLGCLLLCNVLMPAGAAEETAEFPIGTAVEQFISNTEALVSESEAEPPSASEYLYKDDFSDGELAQNLVKSGGNGTLSEANGELALTRTATSIAGVNASDGVQFWPSETHTGITLPLVGIEFTMKKSADKQFSIGFHDTADSEFIRLTFLKNGSISAQYRDLPEGGILSSQIAEQAGLDTYMKWNLLLNLQTKTFSIWKDDVLVLEDKYFTAEQIDFGYVEAVMEKRNGQTLTFDQFNAYSVVPDDATSVEIALADLQFENFTNETMDSVTHDPVSYTHLTLPTTSRG